MIHRVQVRDTSTVQKRPCESGLHGQIAAKKPLLKDTNKKKRLPHYSAAIRHPIWFAIRGTIICFSTVSQQDNDPTHLHAILPRRSVMECCIRWPGLHNHTTSTQLGWVGLQSDGKAANKFSAYVGTPSRWLQKHSRWSWLRECQECAKWSSRQRMATLKNLKYNLTLFLVTTWFHMCYFIVLMSSLLFYSE